MKEGWWVTPLLVAVIVLVITILREWKKQDFGADINVQMKNHAARAVQVAREKFGVALDGSPESIKELERLLERLHQRHRQKSFSTTELGEECLTWGAYVGESLLRERPDLWTGWRRDSKVLGKHSYPLVGEGDRETYVVGWIYKRIAEGSEDNVWHKFAVLTGRVRTMSFDDAGNVIEGRFDPKTPLQ